MSNNILVGILAVLLLVGGGVYLLSDQKDLNDNAGILPYNSGIRGLVMVGPTCPVVMDPPQEECADKPLATLVAIFRESDPVHAVAILESDTEGRFEVSLPPGEYVVGAGEATLPMCPQTPATVGPEGYTDILVSCDSGIR
ncbi:hypothetical protein A3F55_00040 [Candidatus Adlerbacteria bacterium RIFCSPHIGHO2_12_FULL_53_18]|uniref:Carboxypeptidase regulatory-like domain-containing protein n=1 Tax=Candidatus Adlerbacteria bacterium RIFCSPHIGHO2_12_FULL_53_18 TaxID=1797242 RepID=A0A1F4XT42_9BACT|nr:MAG: hypothetical protein A3F55_00040 [Candidatus Adlerbacteria bacterium RIFCSPHIGHO2_12_FULL_53_18]